MLYICILFNSLWLYVCYEIKYGNFYNLVRDVLKFTRLTVNSVARAKSSVVVLPKGVHVQTKSGFPVTRRGDRKGRRGKGTAACRPARLGIPERSLPYRGGALPPNNGSHIIAFIAHWTLNIPYFSFCSMVPSLVADHQRTDWVNRAAKSPAPGVTCFKTGRKRTLDERKSQPIWILSYKFSALCAFFYFKHFTNILLNSSESRKHIDIKRM